MTRPTARVATVAVAVAALVAGCAAIPTSGPVIEGGVDVAEAGEIGLIPVGPALDANADQIVEGFLGAAGAGPTSATPFSVAQEYLTAEASAEWEPYARVLVLSGDPELTLDPVAEGATNATVRASATVVATVDDRGVYAEQPSPSPVEVTFDLVRGVDGQWRIVGLEDGLMLSAAVFTRAYHVTRLYFPTPDHTYWVPDVRWFPRMTWRTNAVREILAGPPEWLAGSADTVVPEGTALAIDAVTVAEDGTVEVSLTSQISEASSEDRALVVAQLEATLADGVGQGRSVVLSDRAVPLAVHETVEPTRPRVDGPALAWAGGQLHRVDGRRLVALDLVPALGGLSPTALAVGFDDDGPVVVRDGDDRIVRVTGDDAPAVLLQGSTLIAPSVDRFGAVWSGVAGGALQAVVPSGDTYPIAADWLRGRTVRSVRVSPEGARIAVVSAGAGGTQVHVAGILRDAQDVPTGLSAPVTVAASVPEVSLAVWQDEAVLALLGQDDDGEQDVILAGVGGLGGGGGGLPRSAPGVVGPTWLSGGVGGPGLLALDGDGTLLLRQSSTLWAVVSEDVGLVAYPG
jgi:Lipoprotein LpqB beta-propeller domain/Sporulation and spore germination